ncbi:MAG: division/cell wall cluster transcriptional repressor MraZ [Patescibacteria group bacterium]
MDSIGNAKWQNVVYNDTQVEDSGIYPPPRHMLIGEYTHTIDNKKRVALPAKFRKEVGKKMVITHGLDGCLFLYPFSEWKDISKKIADMGMAQADTRGFNRFILSGAVEVEADSLGRILIPEFLCEFAGLSGKVVFAGVHSRVEIWDEVRWKKHKEHIKSQAAEMAEKLGETGLL